MRLQKKSRNRLLIFHQSHGLDIVLWEEKEEKSSSFASLFFEKLKEKRRYHGTEDPKNKKLETQIFSLI